MIKIMLVESKAHNGRERPCIQRGQSVGLCNFSTCGNTIKPVKKSQISELIWAWFGQDSVSELPGRCCFSQSGSNTVIQSGRATSEARMGFMYCQKIWKTRMYLWNCKSKKRLGRCNNNVGLDCDEEHLWVMSGKVQDLSLWLKYCEEVEGSQRFATTLHRLRI